MEDRPSNIDPKIRVPLPSTAAHTLRVANQMEYANTISGFRIRSSQLAAEPSSSPQGEKSPRHTKLQHSIDMINALIVEKQEQFDRNLKGLCQHNSSLELEKSEAVLHSAQQIVAGHIKLLHTYNEIKDIGLGLLGLIADREGKRLGDVMRERSVSSED